MSPNIETVIEQVRALLIQSEDGMQRHEIYNQFVNEAKSNNLTEDEFYKKILKPAHKSIDWNYIEEQKLQKEREKLEKEEKEKAIELELEELKKHIQHAPKFIDRLLKTAFDDHVVDKEELARIFNKAERLSQDTYELAERISGLFEEKNFKAYPKANYDLPSLRQTLCSTDWHSNDRYIKLTTTPPEPFNWKLAAVALVLLSIVAGALSYNFYFKEKWIIDDAIKKNGVYYIAAENVVLRKSCKVGEKLSSPPYNSEAIVYEVGSECLHVKISEYEGYVAKDFMLNKQDFFLLNSIFGNVEAKVVIKKMNQRKALLEYFKQNKYVGKLDESVIRDVFNDSITQNEVWQVFARNPESRYNTILVRPIIAREKDFAVLLTNVSANRRKFLLFHPNQMGELNLVYEQEAPPEGDILEVRRYYQGGLLAFSIRYQ